jgi:hypothetical protein
MLFALIALVILGLGAVGLIRSFDTSTVAVTNVGFKRDLTNEAGLAIQQASTWFQDSTKLGSVGNQGSTDSSLGYFANKQAVDVHGIPTVLTNNSDPTSAGAAKLGPYTDTNVTIYFVIDRLCANTGTASSDECTIYSLSSDKGGTAGVSKAGGTTQPIFRLSIRVDGPHNTQAYVQTTLIAPAS